MFFKNGLEYIEYFNEDNAPFPVDKIKKILWKYEGEDIASEDEVEKFPEERDLVIDMFEYNICNQANENLFHKQCRAIEEHIPNLQKEELLHDVDGTLVQQYVHEKGIIIGKNDLQVDALYVESEVDLIPFFN